MIWSIIAGALYLLPLAAADQIQLPADCFTAIIRKAYSSDLYAIACTSKLMRTIAQKEGRERQKGLQDWLDQNPIAIPATRIVHTPDRLSVTFIRLATQIPNHIPTDGSLLDPYLDNEAKGETPFVLFYVTHQGEDIICHSMPFIQHEYAAKLPFFIGSVACVHQNYLAKLKLRHPSIQSSITLTNKSQFNSLLACIDDFGPCSAAQEAFVCDSQEYIFDSWLINLPDLRQVAQKQLGASYLYMPQKISKSSALRPNISVLCTDLQRVQHITEHDCTMLQKIYHAQKYGSDVIEWNINLKNKAVQRATLCHMIFSWGTPEQKKEFVRFFKFYPQVLKKGNKTQEYIDPHILFNNEDFTKATVNFLENNIKFRTKRWRAQTKRDKAEDKKLTNAINFLKNERCIIMRFPKQDNIQKHICIFDTLSNVYFFAVKKIDASYNLSLPKYKLLKEGKIDDEIDPTTIAIGIGGNNSHLLFWYKTKSGDHQSLYRVPIVFPIGLTDEMLIDKIMHEYYYEACEKERKKQEGRGKG